MALNFEIAGGSIAGRDHRQGVPRNRQDDFCIHASPNVVTAVVSDGCGKGSRSEVGASLAVRLMNSYLQRYLDREGLNGWQRLKVTLGRLGESEDDELAYAYFAANHPSETYDRKRFTRAYARRAYAVYRRHHVERGIAMVLKATGLTPNGRLSRWLTALACWFMQVRVRRLIAADA